VCPESLKNVNNLYSWVHTFREGKEKWGRLSSGMLHCVVW
jgi:hypothetical protein